MEGPHATRVAALLGDPARSSMLYAMMGGTALTATELANVAGITKQTASTHLKKLVEAELVTVLAQGRHRYHQIAGPDVAELLEKLDGIADRVAARPLLPGPRDPELRKARVCYDHLAGDLAVQCLDHFLAQRWLARKQRNDGLVTLRITTSGSAALEASGLAIPELSALRRPLCRACLDWSVRRHHLAGALGTAVLQHCLSEGWAKRVENSRVVRFTARGETHFLHTFCGNG